MSFYFFYGSLYSVLSDDYACAVGCDIVVVYADANRNADVDVDVYIFCCNNMGIIDVLLGGVTVDDNVGNFLLVALVVLVIVIAIVLHS